MQIWGVVAGESAFLSKQQFYSAMRLISVAQVCANPDYFAAGACTSPLLNLAAPFLCMLGDKQPYQHEPPAFSGASRL